MKPSKKPMWISLAILLVGCNSFNRYEFKEDPVPHPSLFNLQAAKQEGDEKKLESMAKLNCPAFIMPKLPEQPGLPYAKLNNLPPGDNEAIDTVYSTYIAELRKHNRAVLKIMADAYAKYLEQCKHK